MRFIAGGVVLASLLAALMEVITFSFTKIAYSYAMQTPDGSFDTPLVQVVNLGKK